MADRVNAPGFAGAASPQGADALLRVEDLTVRFPTERGWVTVVEGVSFEVSSGERVALIGESGCGKSITAQAVLGLTGFSGGQIERGSIHFDGQDVLTLRPSELRRLRAQSVAMVFQEPMACLDPAFTVGQQIGEVLRRHRGLSRPESRAESIKLLERVGVPDPHRRVDDYPHTLSGGMRQRALIAQALSCRPRLLIADEPTTALDVTVQAQVLELLADLQSDLGMAVLFVTHDLGVVAESCDRVLVMYAGQIVEQGDAARVFSRPRHPYTAALLACLPEVRASQPLRPLPGSVPSPHSLPAGCRFEPRCDHAAEVCTHPQTLVATGVGAAARCARTPDLRLEGAGP